MIPAIFKFSSLSRRAIENICLYLGFVMVYSLWLNSVPEKFELFENWVDFYLPMLEREWKFLRYEFLSMRPNDSNQSINSPFWLYLIQGSLSVFGKSLFAYRLPDVLLSAFAPVLMAEIVRRFFRADLALPAAILVGAHQSVIGFSRTGGYIGPTLSLSLAIILFGFSVAFENNKRAWRPLALTLFLVPFFYSTVRYYCLIGLIGIAWKFVASKDFRKTHLIPLGATASMMVALGLALTQGGNLDQALIFISARGEQFLITDQTVKEGFESDKIKVEHRLSSLMSEMIPQRISDLSQFYTTGRRFFNHRYLATRLGTTWQFISPYILTLLALGVVSCLIHAISRQRYLILLAWSVWSWVPLLVTTGITPNRMLLGVPADMFLVLLGASVPVDLVNKLLPEKARWIPRLALLVAVLVFSYHSIRTYFADYIQYPNL
jgi:hypothetical protein